MNPNTKLVLTGLAAAGTSFGGNKLTQHIGKEITGEDHWFFYSLMFAVGGLAAITSFLFSRELKDRITWL